MSGLVARSNQMKAGRVLGGTYFPLRPFALTEKWIDVCKSHREGS